MPRTSRTVSHVPGAVSHVIIRFVDGRFLIDDAARAHYLRLLSVSLASCDWVLLSYALMSSHLHLGFLMGAAELRTWAHGLHVRFGQWINRRLRADTPTALGHVLADRPKSLLVCPSRTRFLIAYHHRNPIEAGVTEDAVSSSWTSHRAYMGLEAPLGGLDIATGLELAGFEDSPEGVREFGQFVERTDVARADLTPSDRPAPRSHTSGARPSAAELVAAAAAVMRTPVADVVGASQHRLVVQTRRVALLVGLDLGLTASEMAVALGMSPSGASRLLSRPHDAEAARSAAAQVRARALAAPGAAGGAA